MDFSTLKNHTEPAPHEVEVRGDHSPYFDDILNQRPWENPQSVYVKGSRNDGCVLVFFPDQHE